MRGAYGRPVSLTSDPPRHTDAGQAAAVELADELEGKLYPDDGEEPEQLTRADILAG